MKFNHSERVFHDINYNPPCNYYDPFLNKNKQVLNGTLAGAVLVKSDKNTFGFQQRFQQNHQKLIIPGPTQYFMDKKQIIYQFNKDLSKPKSFLKNTFRSQQPNPSIPYKVLDLNTLNDQQKQFLKQLSLLENTSLAAEKVHKKQPSYSFSKSPRSILPSLEKQKSKKENRNQLQMINENKFVQQNLNRQKQCQNSVKNLIKNHQTIKKGTKIRHQIINSIGPDFIPSLELIELMKKMRSKQTPGPGAYNKKLQSSFNDSTQIDQSINKVKANTFSSVKRFQKANKNKIGPGSYNIISDFQTSKGCVLSKQKRNLFNMKEDTDVYHRFYIDPNVQSKNTIEPLFGKVQRSNSCNVLKKKNFIAEQNIGAFGSFSKRFSTVSTVNCQEDRRSVVSEYQQKKQNQLKQILKKKIKKLHSEDRYSTKQDSGLLGISAMADNFN